MKYDLPDSEGEVLPNLLGLTTWEEIGLAEFEGFVRAEILLTEALTPQTRFSSAYVLGIHRLALEHLYAFAGRLREVNVSKGGFPFPAARFLQDRESGSSARLAPRLLPTTSLATMSYILLQLLVITPLLISGMKRA